MHREMYMYVLAAVVVLSSQTLESAPVEISEPTNVWSSQCGLSGTSAKVKRQAKIIGGHDAAVNEFPWQVSLRRAGQGHYCGGVIINERWVLTAAHCVHRDFLNLTNFIPAVNPSIIYALAGEYDRRKPEPTEQMMSIAQIFIHPSYNEQYLNNDIALILLNDAIQMSASAQPVCPPSATSNYDNTVATVSGWGRINLVTQQNPQRFFAGKLQKADLLISACEPILQASSEMLCAGANSLITSACEGDSGAPLTVQSSTGQAELVGIVSWGVACSAAYQTVFSNVTHFLPWITTTLQTFTPTT